MKKEEFLKQLDLSLVGISLHERQDILRDQEEYIREAVSAGRNEESVIASLGSPKELATNLSVDTKIQKAVKTDAFGKQIQNTFSAVLAILALAPLNLIFVLGPF